MHIRYPTSQESQKPRGRPTVGIAALQYRLFTETCITGKPDTPSTQNGSSVILAHRSSVHCRGTHQDCPKRVSLGAADRCMYYHGCCLASLRHIERTAKTKDWRNETCTANCIVGLISRPPMSYAHPLQPAGTNQIFSPACRRRGLCRTDIVSVAQTRLDYSDQGPNSRSV